MEKRIITISREFGSGGRTIGKLVAEHLGIRCYDAELIQKLAAESGFDENYIKEAGEYTPGGFLASAFTNRSFGPTNEDLLWKLQYRIIRELAEKESCVIVGKCADYVLKGKPNVVSIYIEAPRAFCVNRTMENMGVTEEVANATIERTDKFRADYYEYYTHGNYWTNPVNYDMTLNSERVGVQNCVKTIEQYLIIKELITPDMIHPTGELK